MQTFESFNLDAKIMQAIKDAGFREPSPIQEQAIPVVLEGRDIVAQAQTGTGKTAAFSLPTLSTIDVNSGSVEILVITPTRELATQVSDEMYSLGKHRDIRTVTVYGGSSYNRQINLIQRGASVVVATPGRMLDLLKKGLLPGFKPSVVVLDEADEMLDMGFLEDIKDIFTFLPEERQTLMFSATMPEPIKRLASKILKDPEFISVTPKNMTTNEDIEQLYYVIDEYERDDAIIRLLDATDPEKAIMFCRTKKEVDILATKLVSAGYPAKGLHGDMEQPQREEVIKAFRNSTIELLVATDVAARGINVKDVSHVFNVHLPFDPDSYVHRIGRTGRAGQKGTAITLCTPMEYHSMQRIAKKVGTKIEQRMVPTLGELKESRLEKLAHQIEHAQLDDVAVKIMDALEESIDLPSIALKAISLLLEDQKAKGPESIGLNQAAFEKMLKRLESRKGGGGGGYRGGRRGGGRNRNDRGRDNRGGGRGGRDGGNRGSRDGGSRDGGSRDGGNRDGGNRGGERSGGGRDSGGRAQRSRDRSRDKSRS